ncbi:hypothetical protein EAL2_c19270 [Peptoclostridium acidaminophilum DSM 3953]|uniref:Uncharacterized protein n=1 Tax=Peptoclostridium acidaminophilum DSM 3953 TaxID=1286171 RepID=W8THB6_PEPAC|nr:hypothetical protein [Peptoclostridium acidaminophilum]AHM57208.1 hypothetical protein EAL2_c19270 [Peptoclostridium acidaminophilum DSM 3953]
MRTFICSYDTHIFIPINFLMLNLSLVDIADYDLPLLDEPIPY